MITESTIYWVTRLTYLQRALLITGGVFSVIFIIWLFICFIIKYNTESSKKAGEYAAIHLKRVFPLFILSLIMFIGGLFVPTTKEMCAIKVIPIIANDKQVQELPQKAIELANEWINELKPHSTIQENKNVRN